MPGIKFDITGDNQHFLNSMNGVRSSIAQTMTVVERSGGNIEDMFNRISSAAQRAAAMVGVGFSVNQVASFAKEVADMRSFFQDIESSMKVFLGDARKGAMFTEKLKDYAYYNMFEFKDLAAASQQMIAYRHDVDTIIPRLDQLSNVAVGTHGSLMELVDAYNRAKATGVVDAHGIQSWAVKGVMIRDVLADMGEEAKTGAITFEQLNKVLDKVTGEGGMFHNLQLEMMQNISAEVGQFEDNYAGMLNAVGEANEDLIVSFIKMGSAIVDNVTQPLIDITTSAGEYASFFIKYYEEIGNVVLHLIEIYGAYRAALIVSHSTEKMAQNFVANQYTKALDDEIKKLNELILAKSTSRDVDIDTDLMNKKITQSQYEKIKALRDEKEAREAINLSIDQQKNYDTQVVGLDEQIKQYQSLIQTKGEVKNADLAEMVSKHELTEAQAIEIARRREVLEELMKQADAQKAKIQADKEEAAAAAQAAAGSKSAEIDNEEKQNQLSIERLNTKREEVLLSEKNLDTLNDEYIEKQATLSLAQQELVEADKKVESARQYVEALEGMDLPDGDTDLSDGYDRLNNALDEQKAKREALAQAQSDEKAASKALVSAESEYNTLLGEQKGLEDEIIGRSQKIRDLEAERTQLEETASKLEYDAKPLEEKLRIKQAEVAAKQAEKNEADEALTKAKEEHQKQEEILETLRQQLEERRRINEEIARNGGEVVDLSDIQQQFDVAAIQEAAAATEELEASDKALAAAEELQAINEEYATMAEEANTAAEEGNTVAKQANTVATKGETIADNAETVAQTQNTGATGGNTVAKRLNAVATATLTKVHQAFKFTLDAVKTSLNNMKVAMMANPFTAIITGITTVISLFQIFGKEAESADEEITRFGETAVKTISDIDTLIAVANATNSSSKVHQDAVKELISIYKDYIPELDAEKDGLETIIDLKDILIEKIREEGEERQKANAIQSIQEQIDEDIKNMRDELNNAYSNAEWDGTGFFDDYDADEFQEKAKILTQVIGGIIQTEAQALADLSDDEMIEQKRQEIFQKIEEGYKSLGLDAHKQVWYAGASMFGEGSLDVDINGILDDMTQKFRDAKDARDSLGESFKKDDIKTGTQDIDVAGTSLVELAKNAEEAEVNVSNLIGQNGGPTIDGSSIEQAGTLADKTKTSIENIGFVNAKPTIDLTSLNAGIQATNTILGNLFQIQSNPLTYHLSSLPVVSQDAKGNLFTVNMPQGLQVSPEQQAVTDKKQAYITQLQNANTREALSNLKKSISGELEKATFGTETEKWLTGFLNQVNAKIKAHTPQKNKKDDTASRKAKQLQLDLKEREERENQAVRTADAVAEAKIAAEQNAAVRERMEQDRQHQLNLRQIDDQAEEYRKKNYEAMKARWEATNKDKTKSWADTPTAKDVAKNGYANIALTDEQEQELAARRQQREVEYARLIEQRYKNEHQASLDFLKKWGDLEQQRLAITQEYEEKIREAQSPSEAASLTLQRDEDIKNLEAQKLQDDIDWQGVFSDLQGHTQEYLIGLRDQLQGLLNEGSLPVDQMATIQEKVREINGEISKQNGLFQFQGDRAREHERLLQQEADARKLLTEYQKEQTANEQAVAEATKNVRDYLDSIPGLKGVDIDEPENLLAQFDPSSEEYKKAKDLLTKLKVSEGQLADARKKTEKATKDAKNAEDAARRESAQAVADWFSDAQQFISEKGIDQIPDLLNEVGIGSIGEKASQGLSAFNNAAGAAADFASGNYVGAALKAVGAVKEIGRVFGIGGGNGAEVAETTERLTEANEVLKVSIDGLKDEISKNGGGKSVKSAQEALEAQRKYIENQRGILNAQQGYHHAHHSNASYWRLDLATQGQVNALLAAYASANGKTASTVGADWASFSKLSPEEMAYIRTHSAQLWQTLTDIGKYDKSEFFNAFADLAGSEQEILDQLNESLTQTTFNSLKSSFISDLMDMEKSAEDFAEDFSEMMMEAMLNARISDLMDNELQKFYDKWGELSKDASGTGYELTEAEIDELSHMWDGIVNQGLAIRDQVAAITGYGSAKNSEQSASNVNLDKATYEQFDTFLGIATAQQIALEQGNEVRLSILNTLATMNGLTVARNEAVSELRMLAMTRNEYLLDIKKSNREILTVMMERMDDVIDLLDEIR